MTGDEFAQLLGDFTRSAESGDGARFARHFTLDAIYYDYIYGAHQGRADIAHMMADLFHRDAADYHAACDLSGNMGRAADPEPGYGRSACCSRPPDWR